MWSQLVLCLLVGLAYASNNPGWKDNTEYVYKLRGHTLASLHEVAKQYSGIIFKGDLIIQTRKDGNLQAKIVGPQYSQVHSHMEDSWNTYIPDSQLSYKPVALSKKPFQMVMRGGAVIDLIVSKDIPNWEANIIKSIVSQFQLNINAVGPLNSSINNYQEGQENSAVFKTMEDTVTGTTETLYEIHPLPEYALQSKPWARHLNLKGDGEVIEVVKHKNYTNSKELPLYHYGFSGAKQWKPAANQMGEFFIRHSTSRAILTGHLKRYTVQNSFTVNEIVMSPTLTDDQKGSVVSVLNVTLEAVKSPGQQLGEVPNPVHLNNLVYSYDNPNAKTNEVYPMKMEGNSEELYSEENERYQRSIVHQLSRKTRNYQSEHGDEDSSSGSSEYDFLKTDHKQRHPQMNQAPKSPLLPYTTGYQGMSVKQHNNVNIKQSVQKIAKEIGKELQDPESTLQQNSLNKYTIMTSLIRLMDFEELQEVASQLYTNSLQGPQGTAWSAFRDAVAEAGTGPAFLVIQNWISTGKISNEEAAQVISTMSNAVRQPTPEYMRSFFEFIKKQEVQNQEGLNETAFIAYTNLVRKVYTDRRQSNTQFPVNSFGNFRTEEGMKFISDNVIPYFSQQLNEAVSRGDAPRIHSYIRALGNIAHPQILSAFEPYLEGKKQASQFQRLLMIIAMDKLAETHPIEARSVLYKVYQNSGDSQEVRVAAVYQLMHTDPPADMLQRMAVYTNMDTQEHVNAAVKSSIENAASLESDEHIYLRSAAQAAAPLLTNKNYGIQHGANYLRSYITEELSTKYKRAYQFIGNNDDFYPKGFKFLTRETLGGFQRRWAYGQAMISSIDELFDVSYSQTATYQEQQEKQRQNSQQQHQYPFSSQNIARILNLTIEEREQLEGSFYLESGDLQQLLSFDNHTMGQFVEEIRKYEDEWKNGKEYSYTKLVNEGEMALSFPTETGIPFLYTYDAPTLYKIEGKVSGSASPQVSQNNKLHKPDTVTVKTDLGYTVNWKIQTRLSFTTPFDNQQYIAGYDKNFQMHIPLNGNFQVDVKNEQIAVEIEAREVHKGARFFHYSTWPYTSRIDITKFQPVSASPNTHYIEQDNLRSYEQTFGIKETGTAWKVQVAHERQFVNLDRMRYFFRQQNMAYGLLSLWNDGSIQQSKINVQFIPEQSTARKIFIRMGYKHKYQKQSDKSSDSIAWQHLPSKISPEARQESIMNAVSNGIKNVHSEVYDASVEFHGENAIKYSLTGGYGKSNVHDTSRVLIYYKKSSNNPEVESYEASIEAKSTIPNTNGLDLSYSLQNEPKVDSQVTMRFGSTKETSSVIQALVELRRSQMRKQYLQEQPMYQQCSREMNEGNYQLPACANMTMNSNLLDKVNVKIQYQKLKPDIVDAAKSIYGAFRVNYYPTLEVNRGQGTGNQNQIQFQGMFDPDLRGVNVSVKTQDEESTVRNIAVNEWARQAFVVHPVFHVRSRIVGYARGLPTYRPICVVDQTHASTFNNKTYPVQLSKHWAVMLQYVPQRARNEEQQQREQSVEEQLRSQTENYVVLVRQSPKSQDKKEIKVTFSTPETSYQIVDIMMTPGSGSGPSSKVRVTVNETEVQLSEETSYDIGHGYVQIYALPNGEVKAEISDRFYVIYDGARVKLTIGSGQFRDANRGLCGAFNDNKLDDFLTPANCVSRDYEQFVKSYEIEGQQGIQQRHSFVSRPHQCATKVQLYANVISARDSRRWHQSGNSGRPGKCTKFQTRYVELNGQICFTTRPMPRCDSNCQASSTTRKNVSVHCIQNSNVGQLWKDQIDKGASPDFSHKQETTTVQMELPEDCSE